LKIFFENELFNQSDDELIHRTNSFDQNKNRYAEVPCNLRIWLLYQFLVYLNQIVAS
jgi:hypothetical protein